MSRWRSGCQTGEKLTRTGMTKVRVFRELPETTLQRVERVVGLRKTKQEKLRQKDGDKSTMSRVTRGVEQHKARIIDTVDTSQQRAERLEVFSKTKQDLRLRLRQRQMSTMRRATRGVEQKKASSICNRRWRQVTDEQSDSTTIDIILLVL